MVLPSDITTGTHSWRPLLCKQTSLKAVSPDRGAAVRAADVNLLKVPEGMSDQKVVLLSDILPTGWHGARLANVEKGSRVAIWGCGPGVRRTPACMRGACVKLQRI